MLECGHCNHQFSEVRYKGYSILVEGSAVVDEEGRVSQVGPVVVKSCVKQGKELDGKYVEVICPSCGKAAHVSKYKRVLPCFITLNGGADTFFDAPEPIGRIYIRSEALNLANELFTPDRMQINHNADRLINLMGEL